MSNNAFMKASRMKITRPEQVWVKTVATSATRCLSTPGLYLWLFDEVSTIASLAGIDRMARLCSPEFLLEMLKSLLPPCHARSDRITLLTHKWNTEEAKEQTE